MKQVENRKFSEGENDVKNILKKNQLMITALAIMIAVAGYLQFTGKNLSREDYVPTSANGEITNEEADSLTDGVVNDDYSLNDIMGLTDDTAANGDYVEIESLDTDLEDLSEEDLALAENDLALSGVDAEAGLEQADSSYVTPEQGEIPGEAVFTSNSSVAVLSEAKLLKEQVRAKNKETLMEIINSTALSDEQKQEAVQTMVQMTNVAEKELGAEILLQAKGFDGVVVSISGDGADVVVNALELTDAQRAQIEDIVKRKAGIPAENIIISTVVE